MQLITSDKLIVYVDEYDEISGGTIEVNGKKYEKIVPVKYDGKLPEDIIVPERYVWDGKTFSKNEKAEKTIEERIEELEDEIKKRS